MSDPGYAIVNIPTKVWIKFTNTVDYPLTNVSMNASGDRQLIIEQENKVLKKIETGKTKKWPITVIGSKIGNRVIRVNVDSEEQVFDLKGPVCL